MINAEANEYNQLLECDSGLRDASRDYLTERFRDVRFVFGGRTLSPYLRPHFLTRIEWNRVKLACETIWSAVEKIAMAARSDAVVLDQLGLSAAERELVAIDPGYSEVSVTSRLDSFLTEQSYSFVELNAESPAGIAYSDIASEIFLDLPVMKAFTKHHNVTPLYSRDFMFEALVTVYQRARHTTAVPAIGIIDYSGLPTHREFELFKEYFERRGARTVIADPREVELTDGALYAGDFRIDLVYRRVLTTELLEKADECRDFIDAYKSGAAVFVNSFRTKYVHKKMLFGVLTDERHQHYFSTAEQKAIRNHVPWTRRVEDTTTSHADEKIELLDYIRRHRDHLVLKPNDDYGGHGIFIGWESVEGVWDEAIQAALEGDYLVQERVVTSREVFPFVNEQQGSVEMSEQLLDLDPLMFFGKVKGAFTRLSSSSLANVTSGAGMVPTMILE